MPLSFVRAVQQMHGANNSRIFVAWDGQGDVAEYIALGDQAVFSNPPGVVAVEEDEREDLKALQTRSAYKYIDLFVSMNSDLFILNPRSTFSWEIYVVRVALGLQTLPVVKTQDVYMRSEGERKRWHITDPLWITFADLWNVPLS